MYENFSSFANDSHISYQTEEHQNLWEQEYPYISCDADVLATLYNIGEMGSNNAGPHPNPGSNEFGRFASDHRQLLQCLL